MLNQFTKVWIVDFEFRECGGDSPQPWCAVGLEINTNEFRVWRYDAPDGPPVYTVGPNDVVIAYAAEAEGKCIRELEWPLPVHVLDLLPIFRRHCNSFSGLRRCGLLEALGYFGLQGMNSAEKGLWRELAMRGPPFTEDEFAGLIEYCREDVLATARLAPSLLRVSRDLAHNLLMGRYTMGALSSIERNGVPLNARLLRQIVARRELIASKVAESVNQEFGVYEGTTFRRANFVQYLNAKNIQWPLDDYGNPILENEVFKDQAKLHPDLERLRQARKTLAVLRRINVQIGSDDRCRVHSLPFATKTGRNQPKSANNIFGWSKWMRDVVQPSPGKALVMFDYEQQEFLIAAGLSKDKQMLQAYESADPYLYTAQAVGKVPAGATKETHRRERDLFKTAVLSAQYGVTVHGLALKLGDRQLAADLLRDHKRTYSRYHEWTRSVLDRALLRGELETALGWAIKCPPGPHAAKTASIVNWPVQSTGADILRMAAVSLVEHGFCVCALIHDAVLIETEISNLRNAVDGATQIMRDISAAVLGGPACRVEAKVTLPGQSFCGETEHPTMSLVKHILNYDESY